VEDFEETIALQAIQITNGASFDDGDNEKRYEFFGEMFDKTEKNDYLNKIAFSDKVNFHLSGKFNPFNVRIWGKVNPHVTIEHVRDSTKLKVFCAVISVKVYGQIFFAEPTVTGICYLDMF
jgi:hypothetical protein